MVRTVRIGKISIGGNAPVALIAGPCVIEDRKSTLAIAKKLKAMTMALGIPFIFKASYDKANRTSIGSFRGPGIEKGLAVLREVKETVGVPVLSDVHSVADIERAAAVLDIIQIPAFLCRQTDLLIAAGESGVVVNVKKGQFLAPADMGQVVKKIEHTGNHRILLTERGVSFGYNNLITDFRGLSIMRETGYPVVFDATHSVQRPGGLGSATGGDSAQVPLLARCAVAAGCDALFLEVHPNPAKALSDGPNMVPLGRLEKLLVLVKKIDALVKKARV